MAKIKNCQSCGFPMKEGKDFGTDSDGGKNEEYCAMCYKDGRFIRPDMTLDQMIDQAARGWSDYDPNVTYEKAKAELEKMIPNLKRWKK